MELIDATNIDIKPIIENHNIKTRHERRATQFEIERSLPDFCELESLFLNQLFDNNDFEYLELYNHYCAKWIDLIEWMKRIKRFKFTKPNEHYFKELYNPLI